MNAPDRNLLGQLMAWATPFYDTARVNRAGKTLVDPKSDFLALPEAYAVINNWRASHSYPLNTFQVTLRTKSRSVDTDAVVAQRIKRLESIDAKLRRQTTMNLSQMQDIGGCRAVLKSIAAVDSVVELYKNSKVAHKVRGGKDYIRNPKADGYRSVHLIYEYVGTPNTAAYNGLKIEIQLRTLLQHIWATAVEAAGTFTNQALKTNQGSKEWLRFFALMSSVFALQEKTPAVPGTSTTLRDLHREIRQLATSLNVIGTLQGYSATLQEAGRQRNAKFFLVTLDPVAQTVEIESFGAMESKLANDRYTKLETNLPKGSSSQIVLVAVGSLAALRRAYPNYFLDTTRFVTEIRKIVGD